MSSVYDNLPDQVKATLACGRWPHSKATAADKAKAAATLKAMKLGDVMDLVLFGFEIDYNAQDEARTAYFDLLACLRKIEMALTKQPEPETTTQPLTTTQTQTHEQ
jgi:hypothetical protein